jgi:hypothetical protein
MWWIRDSVLPVAADGQALASSSFAGLPAHALYVSQRNHDLRCDRDSRPCARN